MYGLLDRVASLHQPKKTLKNPTIIDDNLGRVLVSFVSCPRVMPFLKPDCTNIQYRLSSSLVSPDPEETREILEGILENAYGEIDKISPESISLLGVSLGNVLSFRMAGEGRYKIDRLVAITPGANLSWNILNSLATQRQVNESRRNGINPEEEYPRSLQKFNPLDYVQAIDQRTQVDVYLGAHDLMIPIKDGERLAKALETREKTRVTRYKHLGHVGAIIMASRSWKKL